MENMVPTSLLTLKDRSDIAGFPLASGVLRGFEPTVFH